MKQTLLFVACAAVFFACTPDKKTCVDTGCSAGTTCNAATGLCELPPLTGGGSANGGGTATGGGSANGGGTTGGGNPQGGGTSTTGGGTGMGGGTGTGGGGNEPVDAGPVIDPFDDGGVFEPGDICTYAVPVDFDGGTVAIVDVNLAVMTDQYNSSCGSSSGSGNDAIFAVTLTQPSALVVSSTNTGDEQDVVLSVLSSPCAAFNTVACVNAGDETENESLTLDNLPAGTWYVLVDNYNSSDTPGSYSMVFELAPPVPSPANDLCSTPTDLVFTSGVANAMGTLAGALNGNATEPLTCSSGSANGRDVYYRFTLAMPQDVLIEVSSPDFAPAAALQSSCSGGELACDTGSTGTTSGAVIRRTNLQPGDYLVAVDSSTTSGAGAFTVNVTLSAATPPPMNDTCTTPATLVPNTSQTVNLNDALNDYELSCRSMNSVPPGGDVVYTFTLAQAQSVRVVGNQDDTDVVVSLRTTCADVSTEVACNDDDFLTYNSEVYAPNLPAGVYFVIFSAYSASSIPGSAGISLTLGAPILPPANDSCTMPATLVPNATVSVDAASALADFNFTDCFSTPLHDVVYTFTLAQPQHVIIDATSGSNTDLMVELLSGTACATSTAVTCVDEGYTGDPEYLVDENLPAGTYFVAIGTPDVDADFGVSLTLAPVATPATNDTCMTAATLSPGMTVNVNATMAALDLVEPSCQEYAEHDVVYTFTTTMAQRVELNAFGNLDTDVAVSLRGTACDPGDELRCSNNSYTGGRERLINNNLPAGQYWVVLSADTTDAVMGVSLTLGAPVLPPANDNCSAPEVVTFTNNTATRSLNLEGALVNFPGEASCRASSEGVDVVYEVTIPANQSLTVVAAPTRSDVDPVLFARSPVCNMAMDEACIDDEASGGDETLLVDNTTGAAKTVFVIVQEWSSSVEGPLDLTFTLQ